MLNRDIEKDKKTRKSCKNRQFEQELLYKQKKFKKILKKVLTV